MKDISGWQYGDKIKRDTTSLLAPDKYPSAEVMNRFNLTMKADTPVEQVQSVMDPLGMEIAKKVAPLLGLNPYAVAVVNGIAIAMDLLNADEVY